MWRQKWTPDCPSFTAWSRLRLDLSAAVTLVSIIDPILLGSSSSRFFAFPRFLPSPTVFGHPERRGIEIDPFRVWSEDGTDGHRREVERGRIAPEMWVLCPNGWSSGVWLSSGIDRVFLSRLSMTFKLGRMFPALRLVKYYNMFLDLDRMTWRKKGA